MADGKLTTHLAPANTTNAIVNAAFALEFDGAPDEALITGFAALAPSLTEMGFDQPQPVQNLFFSFGPMAAPNFSNQSIGGYRYARKNTANQAVVEFNLQANSIVVVVHQYTKWSLVWPDVQRLFSLCAPVLANTQRTVRSVLMQYTDKFTWRVPQEPFPVTDVLRSDSRHFALMALEQKGAWHTQIGFFQKLPPGLPWAESRVDNVNLSVADEGGFPALTIFSLFRYASSAGQQKESSEFVRSTLPALFELAHKDNKEILGSLLTPPVCEMIGLTLGA